MWVLILAMGGRAGEARGQEARWQLYPAAGAVTALADAGDVLWAGVGGGLVVRFDKATERYAAWNSLDAPLAGEVFALAVEATGTLWAGTMAGLARYDGTTWTAYADSTMGFAGTYAGYPQGLPVTALAVGADGALWVGTPYGLAHYADGAWTRYDAQNSPLPEVDDGEGLTHIRALHVAADGALWMVVGGRVVVRYDGAAWTRYDTGTAGLPEGDLQVVATDAQGQPWVGFGGDVGLARFDGAAWQVYTPAAMGVNQPFTGVAALAFDRDGSLWAGLTTLNFGQDALVHFDGATWTRYNTTNAGLPDMHVAALVVDGRGEMWLGTFGTYGGLGRFDGTRWAAYAFGPQEMMVNALARSADGAVWMGTASSVVRFDGAEWTSYDRRTDATLWGDNVWALTVDAGGRVWAGRANSGVVVYDGTTWQPLAEEPGLPPWQVPVRALAADGQGGTWVGTAGQGLHYVDAAGLRTSYHAIPEGLPANEITALAVVEGGVWAGTLFDGLARFDGQQWTRYRAADGHLPDDGIRSLAVAPDGRVWVATENGLASFDGQQWTTYTAADTGRPGGFLAVDVAADGTLWAAAYDALVAFDGVRWRGHTDLAPGRPLLGMTDVLVAGEDVWVTLEGGVAVLRGGARPLAAAPAGPVRSAPDLRLAGHPNPARAHLTLTFTLDRPADVTLVVYDLLGRPVATLAAGFFTAGAHAVPWEAAARPSGTYLVRLQAGGRTAVRTLTLVR